MRFDLTVDKKAEASIDDRLCMNCGKCGNMSDWSYRRVSQDGMPVVSKRELAWGERCSRRGIRRIIQGSQKNGC